MARPESIAVGGYYKTPTTTVDLIATLFKRNIPYKGRYIFVDPCAGDGEAVYRLGEALVPTLKSGVDPRIDYYTCELEEGRHTALQERLHRGTGNYIVSQNALHGDAFLAMWQKPGADLLYLNPPYDTDRVAGRLEQRFLERFTDILRPGAGVLVYIVPYYVLEASAEWLATHFDDVFCRRFQPDEYEAFKQVVVIARRRKTPRKFAAGTTPQATQIRQWAAKPHTIPTLGDDVAGFTALPENGGGWDGLGYWQMGQVDVIALYEAVEPLKEGKAGKLIPIRGLGLSAPLDDMVSTRFPVVMPPRPAHVAIALAAGLVNGHAIEPDDPTAGLPSLMVKGVFRKEYKVIEEKRARDGTVTSQIAVQQPRLTVSVLDMSDWTYHDLAEGATGTGATCIAEFNIADLLEHYGMSLAMLMHRQCPPLHDPANPTQLITLPRLGLDPFPYQQHGITAALKVIFADTPPFAGEHPFVLGEVGTGKTLIAFGTAVALSPPHFEQTREGLRRSGAGVSRRVKPVRRMLVMCPPHLVASWAREAEKFIPGARVVTLERISDLANEPLDTPPDDRPGGGLTIYLLSREMAKLGHTWQDGRHDGHCPRCGEPVAATNADITNLRLLCSNRPRRTTNETARLAERTAMALATSLPEEHDVYHLLSNRMMRRLADTWKRRYRELGDEADAERRNQWAARSDIVRQCVSRLYETTIAHCTGKAWSATKDTLAQLNVATFAADWPGRSREIAAMVETLFALTKDTRSQHYITEPIREAALRLLMSCDDAQETLDRLRREYTTFAWTRWDNQLAKLEAERNGETWPRPENDWGSYEYVWRDGRLWREHYEKKPVAFGSPEAALRLLEALIEDGTWSHGLPCGERLYQAVPMPRRFPLATWICRYRPELFDMLVLDEAHEYSTDGSAQERAAHRLTELGKPTLILTGTSNNGYASSLFMNMWALSRRFRDEFGRDELEAFVNRYGYRKVKIDPDKDDLGRLNRFGSMSDRVDTGVGVKMRKIGQAPGVLPLFVLRHMLPSAILLQKSDLEDELPPLIEYGEVVEPNNALKQQYLRMREALMARIMDDLRSGSDRAGLLWGQMNQIPTYLDRAHTDTGNADAESGRRYEIRYPESVGRELVTAAEPLDAEEIVAKETWLLETLAAEMVEGRRCIVFVVNTNSGLSRRIWRLVESRFGAGTAVLLDANRVPAGKRMAWIDREVVRKQRKVLVVNPEAVETGLNNLVYFATAIYFQNPNCSSVTYTQANGRIHRPGQTADEVRVYVPYYVGTTQEAQFVLLGHKVAAARQADGLDVTSALLAAGASEHDDAGLTAMSMGQAIYRILSERRGMNGDRPMFAQASRRERPPVVIPHPPVPEPASAALPEPEPASKPAPAPRLPDGPAVQMSLFG